jgi:hypothetical protein
MLKQVAPSLFEGTIGETVRIFAEASNNGGAEAATFSYAETPLEPVEVLNHPGCEFQVEAGSEFCRTLVEFDTGSPTASYELFEEVGGIPFSLGIVIDPLTTGPIVQFQIDGELGAMELAMAEGEAEPVSVPVKKTAKKAVKKTVKKATKKSVAKRVVKERTARKAIKKIARKAARKATRKAATKAVKKTARKRSK